jgi:hypothetical protein
VTDFLVLADPADASPLMLGSIDWEELGLLAELLGGARWAFDDLAWDASAPLAELPATFASALAELSDARLSEVAETWHRALCTAFPQRWSDDTPHLLRQDVEGLRERARAAAGVRGGLWLRAEL